VRSNGGTSDEGDEADEEDEDGMEEDISHS
jgi:hypothetical protein